MSGRFEKLNLDIDHARFARLIGWYSVCEVMKDSAIAARSGMSGKFRLANDHAVFTSPC
jgi:hypothetical protein